MNSHATSADGTRIVFDRTGSGPPVVVISGMFCTRRTTEPLAELLARHCTVVNYDRRGRGDSGDAPPYAVERELEDLAAVIAAVGGEAAVYGHSSGAGLALRAAASGLPISRLVLHEPPYGDNDPESMAAARALAGDVRDALRDDRRADAIARFFADMGMPPEVLDGMIGDPGMLAVASTMTNDLSIMGDFTGGTIPEDLVRAIGVPTLVLAGSESPEFFRSTATRLVGLLSDGRLEVLQGHDHGAPADAVAPRVVPFVLGGVAAR